MATKILKTLQIESIKELATPIAGGNGEWGGATHEAVVILDNGEKVVAPAFRSRLSWIKGFHILGFVLKFPKGKKTHQAHICTDDKTNNKLGYVEKYSAGGTKHEPFVEFIATEWRTV